MRLLREIGGHLLGGILFVGAMPALMWLLTWQAAAFFVAFVMVMLLQVRSEEERLRRDFGEEYEAYCRHTGRSGPRLH